MTMVTRAWDASGLEMMRDALVAPLQAAVGLRQLAITGGQLVVDEFPREPVLLLSLRSPLVDEVVAVRATIGGQELPTVVFAPYSHSGSRLPLDWRGVDPSLLVDGVAIELEAVSVVGDAAFAEDLAGGATLSEATLAERLEGVLVSGTLARLLYLATMEKQRILRAAREIRAMRYLELSRSRALEDLGAGLGVPRLSDRPEPDAAYRGRAEIFSSWRLPTPAGFALALNGVGAPDDPNAGLPARAGISARFDIVEDVNEFALGLRVIAVGPQGATMRARFDEALRTIYLFDLDTTLDPKPGDTRLQRRESIRARLAAELTRDGAADLTRWVGPLTAVTLDRAVALIRRLGFTGAIRLQRAFDPAGGSRYELGLGCDVGTFDATALDGMAASVDSVAAGDDELAALAAKLEPRAAADDPLGAWLFEPCGFRTVHGVDTSRAYLSPLPTFGLLVEGDGTVAADATVSYVGRYEAGDGSGRHVRAVEALEEAGQRLTDAGLTPVLGDLSTSDLRVALDAIADHGDDPPAALDPLAASGLIVAESTAAYAETVGTSVNLEEIVGLAMPLAQLTALGTGDALVAAMAARVDVLFDSGFYSTRGVWDSDGNRLLLLAAVSQLPGATSIPGEPPASGFRWYATEIAPQEGVQDLPAVFVRRAGGLAELTGQRSGLLLLAALGYARRGLADPYEVRIELPDGEGATPAPLLDMDQYGYVMNLLDHMHPIGIEINTFDIRKRHVDSDADGEPEWLTSRASRTYHQYRWQRPFDSPSGR